MTLRSDALCCKVMMLTTIRPDGANHPGQEIHLHLPNDSYWYLLRLGSGPHRRAAKNAKGRRVLQCKACPKSCCAPSTAGALTAKPFWATLVRPANGPLPVRCKRSLLLPRSVRST